VVSISELLSQPERKFERVSPASPSELQRLISASPVDLPTEYLDLLRYSNGGGGGLALPPLLFYPYESAYVVELLRDRPFDDLHDQFFIFGSNGGLELIALDLRGKLPFPVVMIDPIAGEDSAVEIAPNMGQLVEAIGLEYADEG
jgi:hypothetical protein